MSLPTITVIGNLKRIETKFTQSGKQVTKFTVECAEKNNKGEWTNLYLDGEVWEKQAEFVNQYFRDGSVAIVTGKLYTNVYEKQDKNKVYQNKLQFPNVSFAPKDKADQGQQQQYQAPAQQGGYNTANDSYQNVPQQQVQQHTAYQPNNMQQNQAPQQSQPMQQQSLDIPEDQIPF